ncbi:MAG: hypothetical protein ABUK01_08705 [Leptospirales bacterium]
MENEIVEILKAKEIEMDKLIDGAKEQAAQLLAEAEKKYKITKEDILSKLDGEAEKLRAQEQEKLALEFEALKTENGKKISGVNELFKKNKTKAVEHVVNRLLEVILDQEDDKTSDRRAENQA